MNPKRSTPKYIIIKIEKIKDRGKCYSQQEGKKNHIQGKPIIAVSLFFNRNFTGQKKVAGYKCWGGGGLTV